MNWYKIAFPIIDRPSMYSHYWDIGHGPGNDVYIWFIDKGFQIHTTIDAMSHLTWPEYKKYKDSGNILAQGRFDPKRDIVAFYMGNRENVAPHVSELLKKKIEKILDATFGNPKILPF